VLAIIDRFLITIGMAQEELSGQRQNSLLKVFTRVAGHYPTFVAATAAWWGEKTEAPAQTAH